MSRKLYYYFINIGHGLEGKFEYRLGYGKPLPPEIRITGFSVNAGWLF